MQLKTGLVRAFWHVAQETDPFVWAELVVMFVFQDTTKMDPCLALGTVRTLYHKSSQQSALSALVQGVLRPLQAFFDEVAAAVLALSVSDWCLVVAPL
jgi:hypothetical protein